MKIWKAAPITLLVAMNSFAAEKIEHQVTVIAQIPSENFFVQPTGNDNWINSQQKLAYNAHTKKLDQLNKQLEVKSTIGAITGYLSNPAIMASGNENIALTVKVGGIALATTPTELVDVDNAKTGKTLGLEIIPTVPASGYAAGNYQGMVNMIFESETPPKKP
ncbi:CS1 type fimbrial major subunit [Shewanella baltica]|uniref:CS1 type fimbrial major subunit n=1 Tax=Shewanella baltica TaxID=62322 RepID=UPI003D06D949